MITFVMGRSGCGKTSLTQALKGEQVHYQKTQGMVFEDFLIDSPGEYAENHDLGCALALYSYDDDADDTSLENMLHQSMELVARLPVIAFTESGNLSLSHRFSMTNVKNNRTEKFLYGLFLDCPSLEINISSSG